MPISCIAFGKYIIIIIIMNTETSYWLEKDRNHCCDMWKPVIMHSFFVWLNEWIIVFIATFSNISAISWRPVLMVEEAGVPGENHYLKSRCF